MPVNPLSLREREEIRAGIIRNESNVEIGRRLGRHRCTIGAEVSRNGGRSRYRAWRANDRAGEQRKRPKVPVFDRSPCLRAHVIGRLEAKDSPMTIAVELAHGVYPEVGQIVSHETIYRYIFKVEPELTRSLVCGRNRRRKRRSKRAKRLRH